MGFSPSRSRETAAIFACEGSGIACNGTSHRFRGTSHRLQRNIASLPRKIAPLATEHHIASAEHRIAYNGTSSMFRCNKVFFIWNIVDVPL
jgi:hypothetical protein